MRISFTGEHSYEINIQANYGKSVWEKCMEAGKEFNITPYGTETKHLIFYSLCLKKLGLQRLH